MIQLNLTNHQAIITRSELIARLPENRAFRDSAPGAVRGMCEQHVKGMEDVIEQLNDALSSVGIEREEVSL